MNKKFLCYGIRSRCIDGNFVIFADFDGGTTLKVLRSFLVHQQARREVSDFFIIKNENKKRYFHIYCPTKVSYNEYEDILLDFNKIGMDSNFMYPFHNWENKTTVLRFFSPKKGKLKLVKIIESPYRNTREMSLGHLLFLKSVFGVNIEPYINTDNCRKIICDKYYTQKK